MHKHGFAYASYKNSNGTDKSGDVGLVPLGLLQ